MTELQRLKERISELEAEALLMAVEGFERGFSTSTGTMNGEMFDVIGFNCHKKNYTNAKAEFVAEAKRRMEG